MPARDNLVQAAGAISRRLHNQGIIRGRASGAVRALSGRFADSGVYHYRNQFGHICEADLGDYMERAGFFGAHESALIRYITRCLQPGDWAIDAGANVGLLASAMASAVGKDGSVWAVEPFPRNVARLEALKASNDLSQLTILPVALSATDSTGRLKVSAERGGSGWGSFVAPWAKDESIEVPTVPLDRLTEEAPRGRVLRLIKVDVEGFEAEVLAGAEQTLAKWRPNVICEFHDPLLRAAGSSSEELFSAFREHGYIAVPPFARPEGSLDGKLVDILMTHRDGVAV